MKVNIFNHQNNLVNVIDFVSNIKYLNDGRYFVTHKEKCKHCNQDTFFTTQVPKDYSIQILLEQSDEIKILEVI